MTPCLRWALDLGQVSGIWGGTTEEEQRKNGVPCGADRCRAHRLSQCRRGCAQDSSERTAEGPRPAHLTNSQNHGALPVSLSPANECLRERPLAKEAAKSLRPRGCSLSLSQTDPADSRTK